MHRFINEIKKHAAAMDGARPSGRWGLVTSLDPNRPAVKLTLQPGGIGTGWCPIVLPLAGPGWTMMALPKVGDMAWAEPDTGSAEDWVVTGFAHNDGAQAPQVPASIGSGGTVSTTTAAPVAGEALFVNGAGAVLRLCADGSGYFRGNFNIDGDLTVNGNILAKLNVTAQKNVIAVVDVQDAHGSVDRFRQHYNSHGHPFTDSRGDSGTTQATNQPDPE